MQRSGLARDQSGVSDQAWRAVARAAAIGTALLSLATTACGIYVLVVGVTVVATPAVPVGTAPGPTSSGTIVVVAGVIPTVAGGLILIGLALRKLWLSWAGVAATSLFAALFVFSIGGILVPVAAALLVLLATLTWTGVR